MHTTTWPARGRTPRASGTSTADRDTSGSCTLATRRDGGLLGKARLHASAATAVAGRARRKASRVLGPHSDVALARLGHAAAPRRRRVPKLLHHVWLEEGPLPRAVGGPAASWRLAHPDWEQRLWREDDLPDDVRPEVADPLRSPAERE